MLSGIYGYIFGSDDSNDSATSSENSSPIEEPSVAGKVDDDWYLVEGEVPSGRNSPVLVATPEIKDIDQLSYASTCRRAPAVAPQPSPEEIRRHEELKRAKAKAAQRLQLEKLFFEDGNSSSSNGLKEMVLRTSSGQPYASVAAANGATHLKRSSVAARVAAEPKVKPRSKKAGKMCSGANNNRKCNNIE